MSSSARYVALGLLLLGCGGEQERAPSSDTLAPIGTGTERLLTEERLALIDEWIRASIARTGDPPTSLDDVQPPEEDAARYVPVARFLRDGWGRAITYEYAAATRSYELRSSGADGAPGTADDVTRRGTR